MSYEWRLIYSLFQKSRRLANIWMRGYGRAALRRPERVVAQQIKRMHDVDSSVLGRPDVTANRIADLRQAFRQGPVTAGEEARMHLEPWGFEISDVETDVYMWQGTLDESHPISMGRTIASELRSCRPVFAEGAGSLGFILYAGRDLRRPVGGADGAERGALERRGASAGRDNRDQPGDAQRSGAQRPLAVAMARG